MISAHASTSDATLLRHAQAGDPIAFGALYDRHAADAHRVALRMLRGRGAAEDVVQESFLSLWRTAGYDAGQGSVRAYLLCIVHNRAVDRLRRDGRHMVETPFDDGLAERLPAPAETERLIEQRDVCRSVRLALTSLPDAQRRPLELSYFGGLSQPEIAGLLREPLGTVKSRMRLGLQKLGRDDQLGACR